MMDDVYIYIYIRVLDFVVAYWSVEGVWRKGGGTSSAGRGVEVGV